MKLIVASDFVEMPWRNGGGVTHEIARQDDGGDLLWRVSTARVESDCDYSLFPGLMRWSAVVKGNGVRLTNTETLGITDVTPSDIVKLSGDDLYRGALIDGGFRHLNLVFDPKRIAPKMGFAGPEKVRLAEGVTHLIYCCVGEVAGSDGRSAMSGEVLMSKGGDVVRPGKESMAIHISIQRLT